MSARHDVEHFLFSGHLRHRKSDAGIHVAKDGADLIAADQLLRLFDADDDIIGGVFNKKLDRVAENAAFFVDLGLRIFGAIDLALRQRRESAGQRIDHADLDRHVGKRPHDEWRANELAGAECQSGLNECAAAHRQ